MRNQLWSLTSLPLVLCIYVLVFLPLAGPAVATSEGTWTALGPEGGNAVALAVSSDGVVWAGTSRGGGLFRSMDGGASWQRTGGDLARTQVLTVAVDPVRPEIVYSGTASGGIFRSTDGGSTWATINQGLMSFSGSYTAVRLLQVDARTPRRVFAATDWGLYLSRDRGASWKKVTPYSMDILAIAPSDPRFVYVAGAGGAFRSTDGGFTWKPMSLEFDAFKVSALAVHPTSPEIVWAAAIPRSGRGAGLYLSRDGGTSWSPIWVRRKVRSLLVDPGIPDTLWAGTDGGVVRVLDLGARWRFFPVSAGEGVISLAMDRVDARILYAGTGWNDWTSDGYPGRQGGVWRSADRGRTWKQVVQGMIATEVQAVAVPAPGRIIAAALGRGPILGDGRSSAWSSGEQGIERLDIHDFLAAPGAPDTLWAATSNGVFRSENGGRTWISASEGLIAHPLFSWLVYDALALDPSTPGGLWAAGWTGLFHSANGGSIWTQVEGLREGAAIQSVAVDPTDPRRIWATSSGGGPFFPAVFRSTDGGATWRETPFPAYRLDGLAVSPSGTVFVSTLGQLFRSTDGETWQEVSPIAAITMAFDPAEPKNVYAGGYLGLYRSRDEGATWEAVPGDEGRSIILDLAWESPDALLVATRGRGLLRFVPGD